MALFPVDCDYLRFCASTTSRRTRLRGHQSPLDSPWPGVLSAQQSHQEVGYPPNPPRWGFDNRL